MPQTNCTIPKREEVGKKTKIKTNLTQRGEKINDDHSDTKSGVEV